MQQYKQFKHLMFNSLSGHRITYRNQLLIISFAWLLVQSFLFVQTGIKPVLESLKYIGAASKLINTGQLPEIRYYFYLTTTLVITLCMKTGLGYIGVVAIQLLINFLSLKTFFTTLIIVDKKSLSPLISTLVLTFCIPYQVWNYYLYTESLFYSCTLIFFSYCIRYQRLSRKGIIVQFVFLLLATLSRPLGVLLLPCWIILLILKSKKDIRYLLLVSFITSILILGYISNIILGSIGDWQVLRPAEKNYIICEMPVGKMNDLSYIKHGSPINQLALYIYYNPSEFIDLAAKRWRSFFILTRNYYSNYHNYFLLVLDYTLYLPIVANCLFFFKKIFSKTVVFSLFIIVTTALAVGLQCDDYHNRFHNYIIPVFIYLGIFNFFKSTHSPKEIQ